MRTLTVSAARHLVLQCFPLRLQTGHLLLIGLGGLLGCSPWAVQLWKPLWRGGARGLWIKGELIYGGLVELVLAQGVLAVHRSTPGRVMLLGRMLWCVLVESERGHGAHHLPQHLHPQHHVFHW